MTLTTFCAWVSPSLIGWAAGCFNSVVDSVSPYLVSGVVAIQSIQFQ